MATPTAATDTRRDYIRQLVDQAPPLSDQQRAQLRALLRSAKAVAGAR